MKNHPTAYLIIVCLLLTLLIPIAVARGDSPPLDLSVTSSSERILTALHLSEAESSLNFVTALDYEPTGPNYVISAGWQHTCALQSTGAVDCWGRNSEGQAEDHFGPFTQVTAGSSHTCALTTIGAVNCWGIGEFGEADNKPGPYTQLDTAINHTCALTPGGAIECWGHNFYGQSVAQPGPYIQVSAEGSTSCGLTPSGAVHCWGYKVSNRNGPYIQISGGDKICALTVAGAAECWSGGASLSELDQVGPYTQISFNGSHVCAITPEGAADCWGNLDTESNDYPGPYSQITAGDGYTCALRTNGAADCWGEDNYPASDREGPFNDVDAGNYTCARRFSGAANCWPYDPFYYVWEDLPGPYEDISVANRGACGLKTNGDYQCWSISGIGQVTSGPYLQISKGFEHICGLMVAGDVECWGRESEGQGGHRDGPYSQVSAGYFHNCAIISEETPLSHLGDIECWGFNSSGQANGLEGPFVQVSAGNSHTCALNINGGVECWGNNTYGQSTYHAGPYTQISVGYRFTCAVREIGGAIDCWGQFSAPGFDGPPATGHSGPFSQVAAGHTYACGLTVNLDVECWPEPTPGQAFDQPGPYGLYASPAGLDTSIDGTPPDPSASADASFSFSSPVSGALFDCRLDSGYWTTCASPQAYSSLSEGDHSFRVRARSVGGHIDLTPAVYNWTVDAVMPETEITSSPANPTNSITGSFTFSSPDPTATFECQLDGSGWEQCTTPKTYYPLSDGQHSFAVRAKDTTGTIDPTPATYIWTIDRLGPDTTITNGPPSLSNSGTATFTFTSPEATATFECWLDYVGTWSACSSPKVYNGLGDGGHIFLVRAKDQAGNVDTIPPSYNWTIDTAAPDTTITSAPSDPSSSSSASFSLSSEVGASFECRLDGSAFSACTNPKSYSGLSDGSHTFEARAKDAVGNRDPSPASYTWNIDTGGSNQPPNTPNNPNPANGASNVASTAGFSWSGSDPDNDPLTYEVRFGANNPPPQVVASQSATTYDPPGNLANGTTYYWQIFAKDAAHPSGTPGPIWSFTTAPIQPTFPDVFYLSPDKNGTVAGIAYTGSDILKYVKSTNIWTMFFDGSDVGVSKNVSAFAFLPGGDNILLSFAANQALGSLGTFAAQDVARFDPTSTGNNTAGTFAWYFDGSDVGLSAAAEKIDALDALDNGRLLISTTGAAAVPGLAKQQDEDVLAFIPTATGPTTSGTWAIQFDGTVVSGLKGEDVNGFWVDDQTGDRYLTILGAFNLGGVSGNGKSIVKLPVGSNTPLLVLWTTPPFNVDGLELGQ